jgi:hypothetical protein
VDWTGHASRARAVRVAALGDRRKAGVVHERIGDRGAQVVRGGGEPLELLRVEPADGAEHHFALHELRLVDEVQAGLGGTHEHHPSVVGDPDAFDEAFLLHPVDDPRGAGHRGVQDLCQPAHRHRIVVPEQREHVEMGHADPEPHQPLGPGTAQGSDGAAEARERLAGRLFPLGAGIGVGSCSHEVKCLRRPNNPVKDNCSRHTEETTCGSPS